MFDVCRSSTTAAVVSGGGISWQHEKSSLSFVCMNFSRYFRTDNELTILNWEKKKFNYLNKHEIKTEHTRWQIMMHASAKLPLSWRHQGQTHTRTHINIVCLSFNQFTLEMSFFWRRTRLKLPQARKTDHFNNSFRPQKSRVTCNNGLSSFGIKINSVKSLLLQK